MGARHFPKFVAASEPTLACDHMLLFVFLFAPVLPAKSVLRLCGLGECRGFNEKKALGWSGVKGF